MSDKIFTETRKLMEDSKTFHADENVNRLIIIGADLESQNEAQAEQIARLNRFLAGEIALIDPKSGELMRSVSCNELSYKDEIVVALSKDKRELEDRVRELETKLASRPMHQSRLTGSSTVPDGVKSEAAEERKKHKALNKQQSKER